MEFLKEMNFIECVRNRIDDHVVCLRVSKACSTIKSYNVIEFNEKFHLSIF